MTDLIAQLTQLQDQLLALRQQYLKDTEELNELKASPAISVEELNDHKRQLILANEKTTALQQQISQEQARYQTLEDRYQSLADSHSVLSEENSNLTQQLEQVSQLAHNLSEKNRIATERTRLVQERLTRIDKDNQDHES